MCSVHVQPKLADKAGPAIFRRLWETELLTPDDMVELSALAWKRQDIEAGSMLACEDDFCILSKGLAFRQRSTPKRQRHLMSLVLPGDICVYTFMTGHLPYATPKAVTPCTILRAPLSGVVPMWERRPSLLAAVLANLSSDNASTEELLMSVGHRSALERMAHLLCELEFRYRRAGMTKNAQYLLNLTQADIGDYLALSAVHVNRTLQELRRRGLVESHGAIVSLLDLVELKRIAEFSPAYLMTSPRHAHHADFDA